MNIGCVKTSRNMLFRTSIRSLERKCTSTRMRGRCLIHSSFPVIASVLLVTPMVGFGSSWQGRSGSAESSSSVRATSQACVYEGHLLTNKNWYGYLANITVMTTGRLAFEFIYPASKCCQNVLFYSEDQMAVINARMNCWQKEYPLRPEDDQILRLTPRFSWSGCHRTSPNNVAMYVCKGGRSFTVDHHRHQYRQQHQQRGQQLGWRQHRRGGDGVSHGYGMWGSSDSRTTHSRNRPTTWYIALSNCDSLYGLELRYRMEVYGHVGECRTGMPAHFDYYRPGGSSFGSAPSPRPVIAASDSDGDKSELAAAAVATDIESSTSCVVEGDINTTEAWYIIGNASRVTTALTDGRDDGGASGFKFDFTFPQTIAFLNMGIYAEAEQIKLHEDYDSCWHKHSVIPSERFHDRMLELSTRTGCQLKNTTKYGLSYVCNGRHPFTPGPAGPAAGSERQILVAIDNCRVEQLVARYRVEMYGFVCNFAASWSSPLPTTDWNLPAPVMAVVRPVFLAVFVQPVFCLAGFVAFLSSASWLTPS